MPELDAQAIVRVLLEQAGLHAVPEEDVRSLAAVYPVLRAMADALYTVDAARYESPATRFDPAPAFVDWG